MLQDSEVNRAWEERSRIGLNALYTKLAEGDGGFSTSMADSVLV